MLFRSDCDPGARSDLPTWTNRAVSTFSRSRLGSVGSRPFLVLCFIASETTRFAVQSSNSSVSFFLQKKLASHGRRRGSNDSSEQGFIPYHLFSSARSVSQNQSQSFLCLKSNHHHSSTVEEATPRSFSVAWGAQIRSLLPHSISDGVAGQ